MAPRILLILGLATLACGERGETKPRGVVENVAQTLRNEAATVANEVPEAKAGEIETGATTWRSAFVEQPVISRDGATTRPFLVTIRNRADSPQKFRVIVRYLDAEGAEVRTRTLPVTVVEPFTDRTIPGELVLPDKVAARIARVLAETELVPWEEETPSPSPSP